MFAFDYVHVYSGVSIFYLLTLLFYLYAFLLPGSIIEIT